MKKHVEVLGRAVERQIPDAPKRARRLLESAYTLVSFAGRHQRQSGLHAAYSRFNAALAGTISQSFRHPQEAVMVNIFMPCEILHAMNLQPMFPEGISAFLASTNCQNIFAETAEAHDVPESFCSYHKTMLGLAETGVMPKPLMIANTTLACDANQLSFRRLADFYQTPHAVIDIPYDCDEDAVMYVADQLREFAGQLEDLTHRKLDEDALKEAVARSQRTVEAFRTYLARRGNVTLPTTMLGELCSFVAGHVLLGRPESEEYADTLLHELAQAAPAATSRKKRIFSMHVMPQWQESLRTILEKSSCELVGTDLLADAAANTLDPARPYESMARRVVGSPCNGPSERRIECALQCAKSAGADGVILFCHWGCKQTMGISQMVKQRMEAEDLPTLVLDGDGCDPRNVADGQMVTRVNAFLEQLEGLSA